MIPVLDIAIAATLACIALTLAATRKFMHPPAVSRLAVFALMAVMILFFATFATLFVRSAYVVATGPHYTATITNVSSYQRETTDADGEYRDVTMNRAWFSFIDENGQDVLVPSEHASSSAPMVGRKVRIAYLEPVVVSLTYMGLWVHALLFWLGLCLIYLPLAAAISGEGRSPVYLSRATSTTVSNIFAPGFLALAILALICLLLTTWSEPEVTGIGTIGAFFMLIAAAVLSFLLFLYTRFLWRTRRKT